MKKGLVPGCREQMEITVTEEMLASFGGQRIHSTLSTVTLVYYAEWVGRRVILPFLEKGEEGVGSEVAICHKAPAPLGKTVVFTAEVTKVTPRQVICQVWAEHDKGLVGEGTFVQTILPQEKIRQRIESMK
ncbi:thioesterase [Kroppenstedtia pulmonis]|uniref:Thioesterase n=1 Tax=Kroppenstedtia pulmonis TaxID=1380685 RepID=A0A7D4C5K7_9BACL|nr:thioesterase [Kroppenstedtia pulmonis]QKG83876.1 thioesterase [Kroppenstedtia pulmonis]